MIKFGVIKRKIHFCNRVTCFPLPCLENVRRRVIKMNVTWSSGDPPIDELYHQTTTKTALLISTGGEYHICSDGPISTRMVRTQAGYTCTASHFGTVLSRRSSESAASVTSTRSPTASTTPTVLLSLLPFTSHTEQEGHDYNKEGNIDFTLSSQFSLLVLEYWASL